MATREGGTRVLLPFCKKVDMVIPASSPGIWVLPQQSSKKKAPLAQGKGSPCLSQRTQSDAIGSAHETSGRKAYS